MTQAAQHILAHMSADLGIGLVDVIWAQFALIVLMTVYAITSSTFRKRREARKALLKERYSSALAAEICDLLEGSPPAFCVSVPRSLQRSVAKSHLIEQVQLLSGVEREFLVNRYFRLGFYHEDVRGCRSARWPKRLRSLVRLGYLAREELAPLFSELMRDRNAIVAIAASLALSVLSHPLNDVTLLDRLPAEIRNRRDALNEVILNFGERHGVNGLVRAIRATREPMVVEGCVRALIQLKSAESVGVLASFLSPRVRLEPRLLCELIAGLEKIGDPSVLPAVRPLAEHPDGSVRAFAIRLLANLGDPELGTRWSAIQADPSAEVQRVLRSVSIEKAVA